MDRDPEPEQGAAQHVFPEAVPVHGLQEPAGLWGIPEASQTPLILGDVQVSHLVRDHHDGSEHGVHRQADGKRRQDLRCAQRAGKGLFRRFHAEQVQDGRRSRRKDHEGCRDGDTQAAPHHGAGDEAEAGRHIDPFGQPQCQAFAQGRQQGELAEAHEERMPRRHGGVGLHDALGTQKDQGTERDAPHADEVCRTTAESCLHTTTPAVPR